MPKRAYSHIADHFGDDGESIREKEYQYGRFTKSVYALSDNEYWSAGVRPPQPTDNSEPWKWERVISSYDHKSVLWVYRGQDAEEEEKPKGVCSQCGGVSKRIGFRMRCTVCHHLDGEEFPEWNLEPLTKETK
jgi:hypothetical protein